MKLIGFIRRFVAVSEDQALLIALWIVHTHALDAADTTAYLNIWSAEKRSGKTRLLEVLSLLVARAWFTGRVTSAVLVRKVAAEMPTLLLDESDAAFKGDREYAETLRGVLNAGFRRGGVASLCRAGANLTYEDFPVFSAKAIAGIGRLPDTVADRSIPIELRRRRPSELSASGYATSAPRRCHSKRRRPRGHRSTSKPSPKPSPSYPRSWTTGHRTSSSPCLPSPRSGPCGRVRLPSRFSRVSTGRIPSHWGSGFWEIAALRSIRGARTVSRRVSS